MPTPIDLSRLTIAAASALLVTAASGQMTLPPPSAPEPQPEYVPPAPARPAPRPQQARQEIQQPRRAVPLEQLPEVEIRPLGEIAGENRTYPLYGLHFGSLMVNPAVTEGDRAPIEAVALRRRLEAERAAISGLETLLEVQSGLLEDITIAQPDILKDITDDVTPLILQPTGTSALLQSGAITALAAGYNNKIMRDYQSGLGSALEEADPENSTDVFVRELLRAELAETELAFEMLCYEATTRLEEVIGSIDLSPQLRSRVLTAASEGTTDDLAERLARAEKLQLAWRPVPIGFKQAMLNRTISTREDPAQPPMLPIPLTFEGKATVSPDDL